jgi:hypothetical protein
MMMTNLGNELMRDALGKLGPELFSQTAQADWKRNYIFNSHPVEKMLMTMSGRVHLLELMRWHPEPFTERDFQTLEIFIDGSLKSFQNEFAQLTLYPDDSVLIVKCWDDPARTTPWTVENWSTDTLESIFRLYDPDSKEEKRPIFYELLQQLKEYLDYFSPQWWRVRLLPKYFQKEAERCLKKQLERRLRRKTARARSEQGKLAGEIVALTFKEII